MSDILSHSAVRLKTRSREVDAPSERDAYVVVVQMQLVDEVQVAHIDLEARERLRHAGRDLESV